MNSPAKVAGTYAGCFRLLDQIFRLTLAEFSQLAKLRDQIRSDLSKLACLMKRLPAETAACVGEAVSTKADEGISDLSSDEPAGVRFAARDVTYSKRANSTLAPPL